MEILKIIVLLARLLSSGLKMEQNAIVMRDTLISLMKAFAKNAMQLAKLAMKAI